MEGMRREMDLFLDGTTYHVQTEMIPMRIWLRDECLVKSLTYKKTNPRSTRLQAGIDGYAE